MSPVVWAAMLLISGLALAVLELFIPSGGVLGLLAVLSIMGAVLVSFLHDPLFGFAMLGATLVGLPLCLAVALKVWPDTPMGRRLLLRAPRGDDVLPDNPRRDVLAGLVGKLGRARTPLLPSGAVDVDGESIDAVSEGMPIDEGTMIRVVRVRGKSLVVRPIEPGEVVTEGSDDLARPVDSLELDPFEDPLA